MRSKMGRANQKNTKAATTSAARAEKSQPLPTTVRMRQTAVQMASATMARPTRASTLASLSNLLFSWRRKTQRWYATGLMSRTVAAAADNRLTR